MAGDEGFDVLHVIWLVVGLRRWCLYKDDQRKADKGNNKCPIMRRGHVSPNPGGFQSRRHSIGLMTVADPAVNGADASISLSVRFQYVRRWEMFGRLSAWYSYSRLVKMTLSWTSFVGASRERRYSTGPLTHRILVTPSRTRSSLQQIWSMLLPTLGVRIIQRHTS